MCLIFIGYKHAPETELFVLANRDEFYSRPTAAADWWTDQPDLLAGRDLQAGGTWMGITRSGRFAAITNYREPHNIKSQAPSRGDLVADFLKGSSSPESYLQAVAARGAAYNGFNLLLADSSGLWYYGNRDPQGPRALPPGLYGLSNALLDTAWPKVEQGKATIAADWGKQPLSNVGFWMDIMNNPEQAPLEKLPQTGIPVELEQALSAAFIRTADGRYGTRVSTLVQVSPNREVHFSERSYYPQPTTRTYHFSIVPAPVS